MPNYYAKGKYLLTGIVALSSVVFSPLANAKEVCFVCVGEKFIESTVSLSETVDNKSEVTFCFDEKTKKINHLSTQPRGISFRLTQREPITIDSPGYLYWESREAYRNVRFQEDLKTYIEFVELKQRLQIVEKNSKTQPRIAFNGLCRETRRLAN